MTIDVKQFLAKQLNDHSESPSGVIQKTYYEWTEAHITDAVNLAVCYVYSLIPRNFSQLTTYTITTEDCVIDLCNVCSKFMSVVSLTVDGESCIDLTQEDINEDTSSNSLLSMLDLGCSNGTDLEEDIDPYKWQVADGSSCVIKFNRPVPVGSIIRYLCASPPSTLDDLSESLLCEYTGLIADYALWWLFRTDSESRSNLDRAQLHFSGVKDFVTTKLLLEFSLSEDDYELGRRKVDD